MNLFGLFALDLEPYLSTWPFVLAGLGFALIVFMVLSLRSTSTPERPASSLPYTGSEETSNGSAWTLEQHAFSDRRRSVRRSGQPIRVHVTSPAFKSRVEPAYVLDRSTGGLRLATPIAVATGVSIQVRADDAPDDGTWVRVTVRNCRCAGQHYELGCEFETTPPWNVLLLFG